MGNKNVKLTGGAQVGSGTTACILFPPLPCSNISENNTNIVTKLFKTKEAMLPETNRELLRILKRIDPEQKRFIYAIDHNCGEHLLSQENLNDVNEYLGTDYVSIKNKDLFYFNLIRTFDIDPSPSSLSKDKKEFVLQSLSLLHENKICHNDLHQKNIMMGIDGNPRIIDFGSFSFIKNDEDLFNMQLDSEMLRNTLSRPPSVKKRKRIFTDDDIENNDVHIENNGVQPKSLF